MTLPGFEKIVEEKISRAQRSGQFDNLPGKGRPLCLENDHHVPEDLRMAHKILKNSGFLPPEIELKKELLCTEDLLESESDVHARYRLLKKINILVMKINTLQQRPVPLEIPDRYAAPLAEKCLKTKNNPASQKLKR